MSRKENISTSIILECLNDASPSDDELYTFVYTNIIYDLN